MSHRNNEAWMGRPVETLADLLRPGLHAVCVGINPAPVSVDAGHYYQGPHGQQLFRRLRTVGLLPDGSGWEDDRAYAAGVGFTDIVKRPTRSAKDVLPAEFEHGRQLLLEKLQAIGPRLVIFPFKKTANALVGPFDGNGFIRRSTLGGTTLFVMPGPFAKRVLVQERLGDLRQWLDDNPL